MYWSRTCAGWWGWRHRQLLISKASCSTQLCVCCWIDRDTCKKQTCCSKVKTSLSFGYPEKLRFLSLEVWILSFSASIDFEEMKWDIWCNWCLGCNEQPISQQLTMHLNMLWAVKWIQWLTLFTVESILSNLSANMNSYSLGSLSESIERTFSHFSWDILLHCS